MAYKALYRQWRPKDFKGLIGQDHVSSTLKNAIITGRISHAYLFTGPRGTGKTSSAKVLAKALNCSTGPTDSPCNTCESCVGINEGTSMDVFEIDAASNRGIDEIRDLRENVKFSPAYSRYKVYIIDEVHMLTNEAFNALLKTLEEPPAHVVFVLATTEPHRVPATILSRCQRYDFRRVAVCELEEHLKTIAADAGADFSAEAIRLIAVQADGGVRDAVSILDQCMVLSDGCVREQEVRNLLGLVGQETVYSFFDAITAKDGSKCLIELDNQLSAGKDARQILVDVASYFRALMLYRAAPGLNSPLLLAYDPMRIEQDGRKLSHQSLAQSAEFFYKAAQESRWSMDARISAEMALLSACEGSGIEEKNDLERVTVKKGLETIKPAARVIAENAKNESEPPKIQNDVITPRSVKSHGKADLSSMMTELLTKIEQAGKLAVKAQVGSATLTRCDSGVAELTFSLSSMRERVERDDIRKWLEELLSQICGENVRLRCVMPSKTSEQETAKASTKNEPSFPVEVLNAQKLFGGQILKVKEDKEEE